MRRGNRLLGKPAFLTFHIWETQANLKNGFTGDTGHVAFTAHHQAQEAYWSLWPNMEPVVQGFIPSPITNDTPYSLSQFQQMKEHALTVINNELAYQADNPDPSKKIPLMRIKKTLTESTTITPEVFSIVSRANGMHVNLWYMNHQDELVPAHFDVSAIEQSSNSNQNRMDLLISREKTLNAPYVFTPVKFCGYPSDALPDLSTTQKVLPITPERTRLETLTGVPAMTMESKQVDVDAYEKEPIDFELPVSEKMAEKIMNDISKRKEKVAEGKIRYALHASPPIFTSPYRTQTHLHCLTSTLAITEPLVAEVAEWKNFYRQSSLTTPSDFAERLHHIPKVTPKLTHTAIEQDAEKHSAPKGSK